MEVTDDCHLLSERVVDKFAYIREEGRSITQERLLAFQERLWKITEQNWKKIGRLLDI